MSVHFKDYGQRVSVEFRNGPEIACEAMVIKTPFEWIIDEIFTAPVYRNQGCATAILERIKEVSGCPARPHSIKASAVDFWKLMYERGICAEPNQELKPE